MNKNVGKDKEGEEKTRKGAGRTRKEEEESVILGVRSHFGSRLKLIDTLFFG